MALKCKVKKNDEVIVLTGKDKGKKGKVLEVFPSEGAVRVAGVNIAKKHTKPSPVSGGGILNVEKPLHISNVAIVDPKDGKATKVGYKTLKDGKKVRFAKRSGEVIDN